MTEGKIKVVNGREIRDAFKDFNTEEGRVGSKALRTAHRETATFAAELARSQASRGTRLQAKMAGAIRGAATERGARLNIVRNRNYPASHAAFWGQKKRSGWFGRRRYKAYDGQRQGLPKWVGSSWATGVAGEGPYAINDALAAGRADIEALYIERLLSAADDLGLT